MTDYWRQVRKFAADLESDGCSGVPDFYLECCLEHDIHYRTHQRLDGTPITKDEADAMLRSCIQRRSLAGALSPMATWRWLALKFLPAAQRAWDHDERGTPIG